MRDHDGVEQLITMAWRAHLPQRFTRWAKDLVQEVLHNVCRWRAKLLEANDDNCAGNWIHLMIFVPNAEVAENPDTGVAAFQSQSS